MSATPLFDVPVAEANRHVVDQLRQLETLELAISAVLGNERIGRHEDGMDEMDSS
jgi:hypothetical protein